MARRVLNRRDLRAAAEAVERRDAAGSDEGDESAEGEEEEESERDGEEGGDEAEAKEEDDEGEAKPKPKPKAKPKKKAAPKVAKPRKPRATKKTARMRVVWGVFNNAHAMVKSFPYPQRADADALAKQLMTDKKSTHFVNAVKEPIEEKKEE